MQDQTIARFISSSNHGVRVCAATARISTQEGSALTIFDAAKGGERDVKLIHKVLSSGHKSILEHHTFSIAFENVSVLVEQFMIEFRLASFMVKSRRYVDFSGMGFYMSPSIPVELGDAYASNMQRRFADYAKLTELGIPKEDARFVLPYCFFSNFYATVNARELAGIICSMRYGRGSAYAELRALGEQLETQYEAIYPGIIQAERPIYEQCAVAPSPECLNAPHVERGSVRLLDCPRDAEALLTHALAFSGRLVGLSFDQSVSQLVQDARPRELECLCYTYLVQNVSLASITHYARHRIQSPMFDHTLTALANGGYVLPESIAQNPAAAEIYTRAFADNHAAATRLLKQGLIPADATYFALAGCLGNAMITLNARELLHFLKLRTCTRAQWEIRELSESLLEQLRTTSPTIFSHFGPSCQVMNGCPEGRMTCGQPKFVTHRTL